MTPRLGAALVALLTLLLMALSFHPYLGDYGDDAEFVVLGQGLARGAGYAWINSPDHPAHNRYPPGYPLLVAGAIAITRTADDALGAVGPAKVVTGATLLVALALLWRFARRRLPPWWAVGAVALFALSPVTVRFAVQTMSDVPYIPLLLAALLWAERIADRDHARDWAILGALLAGGAYTRSIGLPAAAGILAWAFFRRRATAAPTAIALTVLMAPWWARDAALAGGWRYLQELTSAVYQDPDAGTVSASGLLARALDNAGFVLGKPAAFGLPGLALAVVGAVLLVAGARRSARQVGGAAEWAAAILGLSVLLWPIKTGRYLLPIIPLVGVYVVLGALALRDRLAKRRATKQTVERLAAAGVVTACVLLAALSLRDGIRNLTALRRGGTPAAYYADRPEWAHYLEAAQWLRQNAGADDVAMARRHFALYVYSGHFVDKYRYDTTDEELAYLTAGSARKYVVEDAFDYLRGDFAPLPRALRARGGDLLLRAQTALPEVRVWELIRPR